MKALVASVESIKSRQESSAIFQRKFGLSCNDASFVVGGDTAVVVMTTCGVISDEKDGMADAGTIRWFKF